MQCVRPLSVGAASLTSSSPPAKPWSLGRLNHVAIAVPDLQAATSFYRDILGATVSEAVVRCVYSSSTRLQDFLAVLYCLILEIAFFV